ncbi:adenosylcobinamide-GDP ribazoletransferase [Aeromicrobium sp. UC242_57]|uniref:adenosylcobinamide-GDP ribazoletransferase n=1 Tax=Aeromicrobium sp. UC242_57 TaxID=3374624 RepID=UPI0037A726E8
MLDAWRLAVGTLTAIRVKPPQTVTRQIAGAAMLVAPLAVVPLALLVAATLWIGREPARPIAVAVAAVGLLAAGSRAFHLDGLADTADGLTSSYDRERSLAVMKTGDTGPAGAARARRGAGCPGRIPGLGHVPAPGTVARGPAGLRLPWRRRDHLSAWHPGGAPRRARRDLRRQCRTWRGRRGVGRTDGCRVCRIRDDRRTVVAWAHLPPARRSSSSRWSSGGPSTGWPA